jgi:hypothetical protein
MENINKINVFIDGTKTTLIAPMIMIFDNPEYDNEN